MVIKQVKDIICQMEGSSLNRIYYIGSTGEALAPAYAVKYIADREAENIAIEIYNTSEFLYRKPAALGEKSVVILCSDEGTKELELVQYASKKKAITISLSTNENSLLKSEVDYILKHDNQNENSLLNSTYSSLYLLTTGILQERESNSYHDLYQGMIRNLENIDTVLNKAKNYYKSFMDKFVESSKGKNITVISSGTDYSQAVNLAANKRIEENNIDAKVVHSGEFICSKQFSNIRKEHVILIILGLDNTRPIEEEALSLIDKSLDRVFVLDAKDIDFTGIERPFAKVFSPLIFSKIIST